MAGYRQGVDNHLFYGLDPGHLGLPDDQTFTGGFHHLRYYAIELINAGNSLRLRQQPMQQAKVTPCNPNNTCHTLLINGF